MAQKSFVLIKPDGVQRGLIGEILKRFEQRGLKIIGMKMVHVDEEFAEKHYEEHTGKSFFKELTTFLIEGPVVAMVIEGKDCIDYIRKLIGSTKPNEAQPGTIRGDYAHTLGPGGRNIIHASANEKDAKKEIALWFNDDELQTYTRSDEHHHF